MPILNSAFDLPAGRLLCIDLGQARHGIAVCDEAGIVARPVDTLARHTTRAADYAEIAQIAARERVVGILIGMPIDRQGERGPQGRWVQRYAGRMAAAIQLPMAFWDESLTTCDARDRLVEAGGHATIDAAAAAVILADFLAARVSHTAVSDDAARPDRSAEHNPGEDA